MFLPKMPSRGNTKTQALASPTNLYSEAGKSFELSQSLVPSQEARFTEVNSRFKNRFENLRISSDAALLQSSLRPQKGLRHQAKTSLEVCEKPSSRLEQGNGSLSKAEFHPYRPKGLGDLFKSHENLSKIKRIVHKTD